MTRSENDAGGDASTPGYRHTQKGPWAWLLFGFGVLVLGLGWFLREEPVVPVAISISGAIMLLLGASFQQLTVADEGDRHAIRFGPLPLFRQRIDTVLGRLKDEVGGGRKRPDVQHDAQSCTGGTRPG